MTTRRPTAAAHPRSRTLPARAVRHDPADPRNLLVASMLSAIALALLLGLVAAVPAFGQGAQARTSAATAGAAQEALPAVRRTTASAEAPAARDEEGSEVLALYPRVWVDDPARRVRVPMERLANFDRLRRELSTEAAVEDLLEDGDRRDLVAVRAWVERCGRVDSCTLQDNPHDFDDGRDVLRQLAKESLRDYVKQEVRWEELQDRAKVRIKNFFQFGRRDSEGPRNAVATRAVPAAAEDRSRSRFGAFELSPQADLDLEDSELGVDFGYDPVRYRFLSDWELSYRERVQQDGRSLRLRYSGGERWFDLTAAQDDDYRGDFVAFSITQLF